MAATCAIGSVGSSEAIAARTDAAAETKQEWLEQLSPEARLHREIEVLRDELPDMRVRLAMRLKQKTGGFGVLN